MCRMLPRLRGLEASTSAVMTAKLARLVDGTVDKDPLPRTRVILKETNRLINDVFLWRARRDSNP